MTRQELSAEQKWIQDQVVSKADDLHETVHDTTVRLLPLGFLQCLQPGLHNCGDRHKIPHVIELEQLEIQPIKPPMTEKANL